MLVAAGKTEIAHKWLHKEIKSGHGNLSLYEVTQPDGEIRCVFAVKLQATALPGSDVNAIEAIDEMIAHLQWIKENEYGHSFIVEDVK